jgi:ABC-type nitrate/sulfonate/bicarbonate transport system ATPase subunit
MNLISVKNLSKRFGENVVLNKVSFCIKKGEFISIIGSYGSGKTTLIKLICGLYKTYSGEIQINNKNPQKTVLNREIGYCPQKPSLLPWRTVMENLSLPQEIAGYMDLNFLKKLLDSVGMGKYEHYDINKLSGGMQQLIAIVRCLVLDPVLLVLDEPFSSLDEITREKMQKLLLSLVSHSNKTTILITHSIDEAIYLSDRIFVLDKNKKTINNIFDVKLKHRTENVRFSKEFLQLKKTLRKELTYGKQI